MSETFKPESKQTLDDDARKFVAPRLDSSILSEHNATSFNLVIDWIKVDGDMEEKIVRKELPSGEIQILKISKQTGAGNRRPKREIISEEEYQRLMDLHKPTRHVEKRRHEFKLVQNGVTFLVKYDEFKGGNFRMLEVDAGSESERKLFNPSKFPANLAEVTGNTNYYGYKITEVLGAQK
jgi:hypothetical protein